MKTNKKRMLSKAGIVAVMTGAISGVFAQVVPQPLLPVDHAVLNTNAPTLVWSMADADSYLVEVDGRILDRLHGGRDRTGIFPLSFGSHTWRVIAAGPEKREPGPAATFTVEDRPAGELPPGAQHLRDGWQVRSSVFAGMDGRKLSSAVDPSQSWYETSVPVTVLSALVRNGLYPNPYVGVNNLKIPDLSDTFNEKQDLLKYSHIPGRNPWKQPYWFRKTFKAPGSFRDRTLILNLTEVNYKALIWLNGVQIADTSEIKGMERRFRLNVTRHIRFDRENILAIAVYPPDHPGEPSPPPRSFTDHPGRNMGADGRISLDYTKWDAMGWDWQPAVRDRDMGITDEVFLSAVGPVEIRDPYIAAQLPLPDTSFAYIRIAMTLVNHTGKPRQGVLKLSVCSIGHDDPPVHFDWPVSLEPDELQDLRLTPDDIGALKLEHPRLWWPADWGKPDRYRFAAALEIDGRSSHEVSAVFGVRDIQTFMGSRERVFRINGHDCFMKGGNWVIDMMLNWTASRYIQEMQFSSLCHMNIQRIWGPTGVPPDILFKAADSLGIMIWQDFLNDFWGTFNNNPELKPEKSLFYACSGDIIKKLRNHPGLVLWCGGNEGPNQYESLIMHDLLPQYDPWGGRPYLRISNGDGLHGGGPYHTIRPVEYFQHDLVTGFSSEIGPSGVPVLGSLTKFLPELGISYDEEKFPMYGDWGYHDATERGQWDPRKFSHYDNILRQDYSPPAARDMAGVADYAAKAQLVNYDGYRAVVEAVNQDLWTASSGFALWKFNASWPSLTWQLFDWYMVPNAGFHAVQNACRPVHVQWNRDSGSVSVINTGLDAFDSGRLTASVLDAGCATVWNRTADVSVAANSALQTDWTVPAPGGLEFVVLVLSDTQDKTVSKNVYWRHPDNKFFELFNLPRVRVNVQRDTLTHGPLACIRVRVTNPDKQPAFFLSLNVTDKRSGEPVVPLAFTDNYITLLPGETETIDLFCPSAAFSADQVLIWEGVNVEAGELPVQ
ncbi:hypothetical protein JW948_06855 [bacterium]|nr:hypothetical protein [bacterium]